MRRLLDDNLDWVIAGAVVIVLVVWFAGHRLITYLDALPDDIYELSRLCRGGEPFGRAPAHEGPGPHPIAVFGLGGTAPDYAHDGRSGASEWPPAESVQLVGCVHPTGGVDVGTADLCRYTDGSTTIIRQGLYQVDVYEARTGHKVTDVRVEGRNECRQTRPKPHHGPRDIAATEPDKAAYESALTSLVSG